MKKNLILSVTLLVLGSTLWSAPVSADNLGVSVTFTPDKIAVVGNVGSAQSSDSGIEGSIIQENLTESVEVGESDKSSLQLLLKVDSELSTETFSFRLPGVAKIVPRDIDDFVVYQLLDDKNENVGWLGRAWAHDANGIEVPTSFSFSDGLLEQHIFHKAGHFAYPIVADPYLGTSLINSVKAIWESSSNTYRISIDVSAWTWSQYAPMVLSFTWGWTRAYSIVVDYGWPEVMTKIGTKYGSQFAAHVGSTPSYKNQYDCHAMGAPALFAGYITGLDPRPTWDLEGYRRPESNWLVWAATACGWK